MPSLMEPGRSLWQCKLSVFHSLWIPYGNCGSGVLRQQWQQKLKSFHVMSYRVWELRMLQKSPSVSSHAELSPRILLARIVKRSLMPLKDILPLWTGRRCARNCPENVPWSSGDNSLCQWSANVAKQTHGAIRNEFHVSAVPSSRISAACNFCRLPEHVTVAEMCGTAGGMLLGLSATPADPVSS